ncbi:hypothetical protein [Kitasatospora sp. NPDC088134]|uniref:hypothetical protein n=1 Tax=Kitasatospora sp. NPDC088134 TaxID=3364071 RepID=UPI0038247B06
MATRASWIPPLPAGRQPAGKALLGWLEDSRAPRLCRVSGSSGSGRTHLLCWLATACPPSNPRVGRRVHALLPLAGLTLHGATWLLAHRLGVAARTPGELAAALRDGRPRVLAVTDLDRAGEGLLPDEPRRIAAELLAPLLGVPELRLLVEAADGPAAEVLTAALPGAAVLDLDDPRWTVPDRFAAWYAALPGAVTPPEQLYPSPGLARLAAGVDGGVALDAAAPLAVRAEAVAAAWWSALPEDLRPTVGALAVADRPVSEQEWAALPGSGGPEPVGRAGALLPPDSDSRTWRLTPVQVQARTRASAPPADPALVRALADPIPRAEDGSYDLRDAAPRRLGLVLRHAVRAGTADALLDDPLFLAQADPVAVTTAFDAGPGTGRFAALWQLAGPALVALPSAADRRSTLRAWVVGRDRAAEQRIGSAGQDTAWHAEWSCAPAPGEGVHGLAVGRGPYQDRVLVATDSGVRQLDAALGHDPGAAPLPLPAASALVCAEDGVLLALDAASGMPVMLPAPGTAGLAPAAALAGRAAQTAAGPLGALALCAAADGPAIAVAGSDGRVTCLRSDGSPATEQHLYDGPVTAVDATARGAGGQDLLVVSGGSDGRVRLFLSSRGPMPEPIDARDCPVTAVATAQTPNGLLIAAAWSDGLLRVRRLAPADTVADLRLGAPVRALAATPTGTLYAALPETVFSLTVT